MPKISLLPKSVAELIAAGEVVERPASVIKELVENSIDAGSTAVTVEIKNGGVTFMRVTDNGCGIARGDIKTAFLRHATSKIKTADDLNSIFTLGFRGEALAAVSSVSRVELLTKTAEDEFGSHYVIEGGEEKDFSEAGCPNGTTIIVRDLFYNTPARMKFLRKDMAESNAVAAAIDKLALSHPEVSFRFVRDGKITLNTNGNGDLLSAIYEVCKKEFAQTLIPVEYSLNGITLSGYVSKPNCCRPTHSSQIFFLNNRYIKSGSVSAAVDNAYKNSAMVGRFPAAILNLTVPAGTVDVNVHPAKTEVRFSDDRKIFDCVMFGVRNAILNGDKRPQLSLSNKPSQHISADEYRQVVINSSPKQSEQSVYREILKKVRKENEEKSTLKFNSSNNKTPKTDIDIEVDETLLPQNYGEKEPEIISTVTEKEEKPVFKPAEIEPKKAEKVEQVPQKVETADGAEVKYIGEAFFTYIVAEYGDSVYLIDKHAAHERVIFEELKKSTEIAKQFLLSPVTVNLPKDIYISLVGNIELVNNNGFEIEDFGDGAVIVRAVPAPLIDEDIDALVFEIAENITKKQTVESGKLDWIFDTVSCKSAIKAGNINSPSELESLAKRVLLNRDIMYCPHGRPGAFKLSKKEIEKQFGRLG